MEQVKVVSLVFVEVRCCCCWDGLLSFVILWRLLWSLMLPGLPLPSTSSSPFILIIIFPFPSLRTEKSNLSVEYALGFTFHFRPRKLRYFLGRILKYCSLPSGCESSVSDLWDDDDNEGNHTNADHGECESSSIPHFLFLLQ